mgnify:FL=1
MKFASKRVQTLPPYVFSEFQKKKKALESKGVDVIDLGIGAPDLPTPDFVVDRLIEEARKPNNHRYSNYSGILEYREAIADFYKRQYDVELDPETEVLALIGSKEGIANLIKAVVNENESVLVPNPGYPVYQSAIHMAGAKSTPYDLVPHQGFRPDFSSVAAEEYEAAKLMLVNYPSNPTAGTVELSTFMEAVTLAKQHQFIIAQDAAYSLVTFDGYEAPSLLQVPDVKDVAVEFGSLSKSFNMTGWRIGYVVGNPEVIRALSIVKNNMDTAQFIPIQKAGVEALQSDLQSVQTNNEIYKKRMDDMLDGLSALGIHVDRPRGTFFIWAPVPEGYTSAEFADELLMKAGVIVTPGTAFGTGGEGYFRVSLSVATERLQEAVKRMKEFSKEGASK